MQCSFEADEEIVAIANYFKCPVASQDSDFYIFDIAGGFVRLDSIINVPSVTSSDNGDEVNSLSCKWYHVDHLLSHFPGFDRSLLPLFATLLGNDFVSKRVFDNFFSQIPKLQGCSKRKLKISKRHTHMVALLHWLSSKSASAAMSQVLRTFKSSDRDQAGKLVLETVGRYKACTSPFVENLRHGSPLQLLGTSGKAFPPWFAEQFFGGVLNPYLLNVAVLRKVFHLAQIDCFDLQSSYACSLLLRRTLYGLLLNAEEDGNVLVEEFDREGRSMTRQPVKPLFSVENYGRLPTLHEIVDLDISVRQKLFNSILGFDAAETKYPERLHTILAVIHYWLVRSASLTNENLVRSLLLGALLLRLLPKVSQPAKKICGKMMGSTDPEGVIPKPITDILISVDEAMLIPDDVDRVHKNFFKFFSRPTHNNAKHFDSDLVYSCNQFQTCYLFAKFLNRVLLKPYPEMEIHNFLNGTFLYNFTKELDTRPNPELFIAEYLGRGTPLEVEFLRLYRSVRKLMPDSSFEVRLLQARQKKRVSCR